MSTQNNGKVGVVLMTYGSATTAEHVADYFNRIYNGKASEALLRDFENRYRLIGRSPLVEITETQAELLEKRLGEGYIVRAGMRHSAPSISEAVKACRGDGVDAFIGVILSPQLASFITKGYEAPFLEAAAGGRIAHSWPAESHFIELTASRITESLQKLRKKYERSVPIIFTTHSMPRRVVETDPGYLKEIQTTIDTIRERLDPEIEWYAGYQSAGHTPEEWLTPDLTHILEGLSKKETPGVLIVPIQFIADHLEVLYDLDIAAREQCEARGIDYHRITLPNTDPLFIDALASIVKETLALPT